MSPGSVRIKIGTQDLTASPFDPSPVFCRDGDSRHKDPEGPRVLPQRLEEQGDEKLKNYSLKVAPVPARAVG